MFYFIEIFVIAKLYVVLTTLLTSINGDPEPQETTQPPPQSPLVQYLPNGILLFKTSLRFYVNHTASRFPSVTIM